MSNEKEQVNDFTKMRDAVDAAVATYPKVESWIFMVEDGGQMTSLGKGAPEEIAMMMENLANNHEGFRHALSLVTMKMQLGDMLGLTPSDEEKPQKDEGNEG